MRVLILADIHANLNAFQAVISDAGRFRPDAAVFLGDLIDYGPRPNEVAVQFEACPWPWLYCLRGNHEQALFTHDYSAFSSQRGGIMSQYTETLLTSHTKRLLARLEPQGQAAFTLDGLHILAVHGSLDSPFWGSICPGETGEAYCDYDLVLSAHSHRPHRFACFLPCPQSPLRGEKKVMFLNPGSVGQPRNHNPRAQYAVFDTRTVETFFAAVDYSIAAEQRIYPAALPQFYRERLALGI